MSNTIPNTISGALPDDGPVPANETMIVDSRKVVCDGGSGPLGHPRVYLRILENEIQCPYCSRRFILEPGGGGSPGQAGGH